MKKYFGVWGGWQGCPSCYDDQTKFITDSFFTEDKGYDKEDIDGINKMEKVSDVWYSDQGNHFIVRLPNDFVAPFETTSKIDGSKWHQMSIEDAISKGYLGQDDILDADEPTTKQCNAVWVKEVGGAYGTFWIQELTNGEFYTVAGQDSECASFDKCVECLLSNL